MSTSLEGVSLHVADVEKSVASYSNLPGALPLLHHPGQLPLGRPKLAVAVSALIPGRDRVSFIAGRRRAHWNPQGPTRRRYRRMRELAGIRTRKWITLVLSRGTLRSGGRSRYPKLVVCVVLFPIRSGL
jgi:hypothetical protein